MTKSISVTYPALVTTLVIDTPDPGKKALGGRLDLSSMKNLSSFTLELGNGIDSISGIHSKILTFNISGCELSASAVYSILSQFLSIKDEYGSSKPTLTLTDNGWDTSQSVSIISTLEGEGWTINTI